MGLQVLAVDPGVTTGVLWVIDECLKTIREVGIQEHRMGCAHCGYTEVVSALKDDSNELWAAKRLAELVDEVSPDVLVIEDFVLQVWRNNLSAARAGLSPVRITAMFQVWVHDVLEFDGVVTYQNASAAKGIFTDERLRNHGFWVKGSAHIRDAARHALLATRRAHNGEI